MDRLRHAPWLYGFIITMPLVGGVAWFGLIEDAGDVHATAASILLPLIGLHVAGALAETFIFRNDALKRMFVPNNARLEP